MDWKVMEKNGNTWCEIYVAASDAASFAIAASCQKKSCD